MIMPDNRLSYSSDHVLLENTSRSKFDLGHTVSGTCTAGKLNVITAYSQVYPGDTFKLNMKALIRSTTPVAPTMDQLYLDVYWFFVPHTLSLSRESMSSATDDATHSFKAFIGAQDNNINMPTPDSFQLPYLLCGSSTYNGSLGDQLGIPLVNTAEGIKIEPFEALAYWNVWNNFFRDPNTMNPITFSIESGQVLISGGPYDWVDMQDISDDGDAGVLMPVCRYKGYFGSALPWPQRNLTSVTLPLGDIAPVMTSDTEIFKGDSDGKADALIMRHSDGTVSGATGFEELGIDLITGAKAAKVDAVGPVITPPATAGGLYPSNLYADLKAATAASVNQFRFAVQSQRWYEALARGGNSFEAITECMFGVKPHYMTASIPEYLGGKHIPLNIIQVANTAGTTYSTATQQSIGSTGAFSLTSDDDYYFTKSFDTWGTLIGVFAIRPHESFCQGINRRFTIFDREQYYWRQFAHLGEQPIYNKEIFVQGTDDDDGVFGYQEAYAHLRFLPDVVCGALSPLTSNNISYWTYVNHFSSLPTLAGYLDGDEIYKNIDRTLQVKNITAGFQFMYQFGLDLVAVRPMPTYSVPGLVDHY